MDFLCGWKIKKLIGLKGQLIIWVILWKRVIIWNGLICYGSKKEIIVRNLVAGIFRGVGIGIGVTVITAVLVFLLQKIVTLNIPVIGEYIADIVEIVEKSR